MHIVSGPSRDFTGVIFLIYFRFHLKDSFLYGNVLWILTVRVSK